MLGFNPVEFKEVYAGHDLNLTRMPFGARGISACEPGHRSPADPSALDYALRPF